ncbi:uncharacterized protein A4U43_C03F24990 [Asparagus officinalis]|uniref:Uncharacterized protein n=1 Tax=Asparagus officinalis TaxID=4686 RepID=A0A5P1FCV5_ASPOF|nr:uncharacterized protein A4U43_C03F24990 [Asparagus officinalis]
MHMKDDAKEQKQDGNKTTMVTFKTSDANVSPIPHMLANSDNGLNLVESYNVATLNVFICSLKLLMPKLDSHWKLLYLFLAYNPLFSGKKQHAGKTQGLESLSIFPSHEVSQQESSCYGRASINLKSTVLYTLLTIAYTILVSKPISSATGSRD